VLQAAALGLGAAGLASAGYQGYGMALDRCRYPPLGDLVDVGGRKLHLLVAPGYGPPLVIIAALGTPAIDWLAVQRALAPEVPVVVYDRGGIGWSGGFSNDLATRDQKLITGVGMIGARARPRSVW
jgi:pimeloyl-ACP methyl ester carboxylesterase